MKDRALVEQFTSQIELYVGAPQDLNPAGVQGPLLLRSKKVLSDHVWRAGLR